MYSWTIKMTAQLLQATLMPNSHRRRRRDETVWSRRRRRCELGNITLERMRPFNGPLSGTTRVSRYKKGKTNLDFTEARDSE